MSPRLLTGVRTLLRITRIVTRTLVYTFGFWFCKTLEDTSDRDQQSLRHTH